MRPEGGSLTFSPQPPTPGSLLLPLSRFSRVRLCATPQTAAHQAPRSLGFSRQEHWSGVPLPSPPGSLRVTQTNGHDVAEAGGGREGVLHGGQDLVETGTPLPVERQRARG